MLSLIKFKVVRNLKAFNEGYGMTSMKKNSTLIFSVNFVIGKTRMPMVFPQHFAL